MKIEVEIDEIREGHVNDIAHLMRGMGFQEDTKGQLESCLRTFLGKSARLVMTGDDATTKAKVEALTAAGILSVQHRMKKLMKALRLDASLREQLRPDLKLLDEKTRKKDIAGLIGEYMMNEGLILWESGVVNDGTHEIKGTAFLLTENDMARIERELRGLFAKAFAAGAPDEEREV